MVNIREFYEKDGKCLPGKKVLVTFVLMVIFRDKSFTDMEKGISLTLEQYRRLLCYVPAINDELRNKGENVSLPELQNENGNGNGLDNSSDKKDLSPKGSIVEKKNFEAISEEDEG